MHFSTATAFEPPDARQSDTTPPASPRLQRFNALWSNERYTRRRSATDRRCCPLFEEGMHEILSAIPDDALPEGVRRIGGRIGSSDIFRRADDFRAVLARLDG